MVEAPGSDLHNWAVELLALFEEDWTSLVVAQTAVLEAQAAASEAELDAKVAEAATGGSAPVGNAAATGKKRKPEVVLTGDGQRLKATSSFSPLVGFYQQP